MPEANRSKRLMFIPVVVDRNSSGSSWMPSSRPRGCDPHSHWESPSIRKARPMVAMKSVICGWFTSGRNTTRSVRMPSTIITASVSTRASQKLTPCSVMPTKVSAAKNTIAPWAKLNTPDAL